MKHSLIRRSVTALLPLVFMVDVAMTSEGCLKASPAKTVLDVAEMTCVLLHDDVQEPELVAKICGIADEYWDLVKSLVSARKSAAALKSKSAAPPSDAGVPSDGGK